MRGRINMPPDCVIALVHAVKSRQKELRDHTKLDSGVGTIRNQAWKEITDELNTRSGGREITVEQSMKKFLNIKTMVKYKMEEESKKRQQPGYENFNIRLTPAEHEYLRLFCGINRRAGTSSNVQQIHDIGDIVEDEDEEEEGDNVSPQTMTILMGKEDSFQVGDFAGTTSSVTETLLGMIPIAINNENGNNRQSSSTNSRSPNEHISSEVSISSSLSNSSHSRQNLPPLSRETPMKMIGLAANNDNANISSIANNQKIFLKADNDIQQCREPTNGINFGRKRKAEEGEGMSNKNVGDPEKRLKQLKCELIEMQKLELMRREEWRLKKEFMVGRQTAALENIALLLREIRNKQK